MHFNYQPNLVHEARLSIYAVLKNPGIWEKSIELQGPIAISGDYEAMVSLDIANYEEQFREIEDEIGIADTRYINIEIHLDTDQQQFLYQLPIKLGSFLIEIDKDLIQRKTCGKGIFSLVVNLKPNSAFNETSIAISPVTSTDENTVGPGETIFTSLADTIDVSYNYEFWTYLETSEVSSQAQMKLVLQAGDLWSKEFHITEKDGDNQLSISSTLDLSYFIDLLSIIQAETSISAENYYIKFITDVNTTAQISNGNIIQDFTQELSWKIT